ncbi:hypothetical protein [Desulfogranum japonicum]|uniref:hypothetical protein n=1 Tax=Desulfogranum japonicum TaxID=231447 RepID=UPI00048A80A8|nr:hypothetical protein [Desulfogranum japonicum]
MKTLFTYSQVLILPIIGIMIILRPVHAGYKFSYDLRGGLQWVVGISFIIVGLFLLILQLRRRETGTTELCFPAICPKCEEVFFHDEELLGPSNCPACNVKVETLKNCN